MQLRFSLIGAIYLMMLMIPNLIWTKHQPDGYDPADEPKWLLWLERMGEISVSACALFLIHDGTYGSLAWLILSMLCMLLYELFWIRYFKDPTLSRFYGSMFHIPLPGASLPLLAFLFYGIYTHHIALLMAVLIMAIGHLGIHLHHAKKHHIALF